MASKGDAWLFTVEQISLLPSLASRGDVLMDEVRWRVDELNSDCVWPQVHEEGTVRIGKLRVDVTEIAW